MEGWASSLCLFILAGIIADKVMATRWRSRMTGGIPAAALSRGALQVAKRRPLSHWAVNAGYYVVAFVVMGAIIAAWR